MTIATPMTEGYEQTEIARQLGRDPHWVSERLSELRQEILHQNALLPPLSDHDYQALKQNIRQHGIHNAILVGQHIPIVDGHNRAKISVELDIPCPCLFLDGLTRDEEHELAIGLNAARRHLTRQQRRKLIENELARDPTRSDRRIAAVCGAHHELVATVRREMIQQARAWIDSGLSPRESPPIPPDSTEVDVAVSATSPPVVRYVESHTPTAVPAKPAEPLAQPIRRIDTLGRRVPVAKARPIPPTVHACPHCGEGIVIVRNPKHSQNNPNHKGARLEKA